MTMTNSYYDMSPFHVSDTFSMAAAADRESFTTSAGMENRSICWSQDAMDIDEEDHDVLMEDVFDDPMEIDSVHEEVDDPMEIDSVHEEHDDPMEIDSVHEEHDDPMEIDSVHEEHDDDVSMEDVENWMDIDEEDDDVVMEDVEQNAFSWSAPSRPASTPISTFSSFAQRYASLSSSSFPSFHIPAWQPAISPFARSSIVCF